eukprot:351943-Chlamydomonas_euryale.AAC.12
MQSHHNGQAGAHAVSLHGAGRRAGSATAWGSLKGMHSSVALWLRTSLMKDSKFEMVTCERSSRTSRYSRISSMDRNLEGSLGSRAAPRTRTCPRAGRDAEPPHRAATTSRPVHDAW